MKIAHWTAKKENLYQLIKAVSDFYGGEPFGKDELNTYYMYVVEQYHLNIDIALACFLDLKAQCDSLKTTYVPRRTFYEAQTKWIFKPVC